MQKPDNNYSPAIKQVIDAVDKKHIELIKQQSNVIDDLKANNPVPYWAAVAIAILTILHLVIGMIDTVKGWM
jgi:predicted phosphoadenosine phosphosulfate sulfurtransferase